MDGDFTGTGRFVIERHLGAGSMGSVYLAHDRQLGSRIALKVLLSVDASGIYRFKNEFRALADVVHPNLVSLHELFSEGDHWFFTMDYVEGKDLLSFVHGARRRTFESTPKPLSEPPASGSSRESFDASVKGLELLFPTPLENEDRLRDTLVQVVEGLLAVHGAGQLHRDLKPENVLVTEQGQVMLLDFGIALEKQQHIHATVGSVMGTPAYMAPEQCRGLGITEAADWYALGVMLYEALTGDVPIDGSPLQIIQRKQEYDPPAPRDVVSGVPADLNTLCMQLLQRDPAARPSGEAVLRALRGKRAASSPAPAETSSMRRLAPAFVGREAQLAELDAALAATQDGKPTLVLLHGPPGIGKTSLVERFIEKLVDDERAIVLRGRCYERESVPFKAFDNVIDSLSRYLRRLPPVDAARVLPRDIDVLAELFPVLKRVDVVRRTRRPRALPLEPQELRQRAFRAFKEMLSRIADVEPLVLCIDDLQWSDVDSARLLGEVIGGADRPAIMLVCMHRSGDSSRSVGLDAFLGKVDATSDLTVREIAVGVLSAEESLLLARSLLGSETGEEGARTLGFESGGNPQVLTQMVRHVEERRASGKASPETAKGLINFERVIEQRLGGLSNDARTLLELLSVAGRPVPEAMLTLVSSFNISLSSALAELRGKKLVRGVAARDSRAVEVYHDTIREAVTASMPHETLVSWHRRLAAALEASGALDLEALTEHLLGASDCERASLYASRAAAQAESCLAFDKAARLYGIAAEHSPDPERRRELLVRWADALVEAGRGVAAATAYADAAKVAPPAEAMELEARAGAELLFAGQLEPGLALLKEPLTSLGVALPDSFHDAITQASYMWREIRARGFGFVERTPAQVEAAELRRLDLLWGVTRGLLSHEVARPLPLVTRFLIDALEIGEPLRIVRGLVLFHTHVDGPFSRLSKLALSGALDVGEALARRIEQSEARALLALSRGLSMYSDGRVEAALPELVTAEDILRNHCRGGAYEMRTSRMALAHAQFVVHREANPVQLREWLREAGERGDPLSEGRLRQLLAVGSLAADDAKGALVLLAQASGGVHARSELSAMTGALSQAAVHLYRGDIEACRGCYDALLPTLSEALGTVPFWRACVLMLLARLGLVISAGVSGQDAPRIEQAAKYTRALEALDLPCFMDDVRLLTATVALARRQPAAAKAALEPMVRARVEAGTGSFLHVFAQRAHGQLIGGAEGKDQVARAEELLVRRGVVQPRRFARLILPAFEERLLRP